MEIIKLYLKNLGITLAIILIATFLITILDYFSIIGVKVVSVLKLMIPLIAVIVGAFKTGKSAKQRGWLEGIKFGLLFLLVTTAIVYLAFAPKFSSRYFIYYLILIASSTLGSMIGISKKEPSN